MKNNEINLNKQIFLDITKSNLIMLVPIILLSLIHLVTYKTGYNRINVLVYIILQFYNVLFLPIYTIFFEVRLMLDI